MLEELREREEEMKPIAEDLGLLANSQTEELSHTSLFVNARYSDPVTGFFLWGGGTHISILKYLSFWHLSSIKKVCVARDLSHTRLCANAPHPDPAIGFLHWGPPKCFLNFKYIHIFPHISSNGKVQYSRQRQNHHRCWLPPWDISVTYFSDSHTQWELATPRIHRPTLMRQACELHQLDIKKLDGHAQNSCPP